MSETPEELAHRWQNFRIRCLELAIGGGAKAKDMIEVADKLADYILTISEREKATLKTAQEEQK